jgi:hypothetical protein
MVTTDVMTVAALTKARTLWAHCQRLFVDLISFPLSGGRLGRVGVDHFLASLSRRPPSLTGARLPGRGIAWQEHGLP